MENDMTRNFFKALATAAFCVLGIASVAQAQDKWDSAAWIDEERFGPKNLKKTASQYAHQSTPGTA